MKTDIIVPNSLITIQLSPYFISRIQEMAIWMLSQKDPESQQLVHAKISNDEPLEDWEQHYYTALALIHEAETAARVQQKTKTVDLPDAPGSTQ